MPDGMVTDENVLKLEQIHSTEAAAAAAAAALQPHLSVTPESRDADEDAGQVKTNTGDSGGVSSWTCDDVTRWLADNQLHALRNWYILTYLLT